MDILPQNFKTLSFCGLWSENDSTISPFFFIYKIFVLFLISHISLGQVFYVFVTSKSVKELTNGLVFTVTFVTLCVKLLNFITKVKDMKRLLNIFREDICQPKLMEEEVIVNNYRRRNLRFFYTLIIISNSVGLSYMCQPIFQWGEIMELPLGIYDPFYTRDFTILTIFYVLQIVECVYSICLNICLDTMTFGFINLTCSLFDVLCLRLENIGKGENLSTVSFKDCFKLHIVILKILKSLNSFFMGPIAIMFILSLLVICSGIFQITEKSSKFSVDKVILLYYILNIITYTYVYCWFGTELEEKVKNLASTAYEVDWSCASTAEVKNLSFMILIAQKGSTISYKGICTLSHETFGLMMKSSYAALNVLKCYSEI